MSEIHSIRRHATRERLPRRIEPRLRYVNELLAKLANTRGMRKLKFPSLMILRDTCTRRKRYMSTRGAANSDKKRIM